MTVPPIHPHPPEVPARIQGEERFSQRKGRRSFRVDPRFSAGTTTAKEMARFALAELTNPASMALADLGASAVPSAQDQGGGPAALALAQLGAPALTALTGNADAAGPLTLSEAIDAASVLASAQALPDALAADPAEALQGAVLAAQEAAAAAQNAAAAMADAAKAVALAAGALSAATVAPSVPDAAPQGPGTLAADATAKYLGGGFLGPAGAPSPEPPIQEDPGIAKVPAASASAPQTYSNPHDLAFGQTSARAEALPAAQGLDLTI